MEFVLPYPIPSIFAFLLFLYYLHRKRNTSTNKRVVPPEAGGAWPIIGHLLLLADRGLAHKVLGALADKHGPIFTIQVGVQRAIVVSNSDIAKECLTGSNDRAFTNRGKSIALEHLTYNYASFGFGPYGTYWREMRKISVTELLSNQRLAMLSHVRESEVENSVREVYGMWVKEGSCMVEMKRWFEDLTMKVTVRILAGNAKMEADEAYRVALKEFFELAGAFIIADAIPFLRWLDMGGYEKKMKTTAKKMDDLLQLWLDEHKRRRNSGGVAPEAEKDFMDGFTLAGADTIPITLTWAVALLLNNPHALRKAQEELDTHVGRQRKVKETDMKNLVYIQAIIRETMRLRSPIQLFTIRETTEDCTVRGYHVPAGTRLFVNLWKIHHDPQAWAPDPWEFRPERFLTTHKDVDLRGKHFDLIPFGSGRRVCPGISFTTQILELTLASLVHAFEIATPTGEPVDMTEGSGFPNKKVMPLEVRLTPRWPPELYGESATVV
ncbi:hypothetical protein RHMOL_Rhmol06G0059500 [Rhododendron molle]|uniref:Uncharacterized protein n=1 Tax=Rhododendron molle TaxID=49168 RepID=A0ACC0N9M4_RHOML|nr:hypothetical protein RHMOL_Rhmol06G0059500 [Rhododendron molle]